MNITFVVFDPCDPYELPLFVTSSASEVARYVGCSREHSCRSLYKAIRDGRSFVLLRTFAVDIVFY